MNPPVDAQGPGVDPETLAQVEAAQARWRGELADLGGRNSLMWHRDLPTGTLDLTVAHPGGVAKVLAGRNTLLSELVRESVALAEARRRVAAIRGKAVELQREYGLSTLYLAVGMASWQLPRAPIPPRAPVLLRGARIRPTDATRRDFVLRLDSDVIFNPALEHYLRAERGLTLDGPELARLSAGRNGFDPRPTYDALEEICAQVPSFGIGPQLILSTYPLAKLPLVAELTGPPERLARRPLVVTLATETGAAAPEADASVAEGPTPASPGNTSVPDRRGAVEPVLEADRSQREILTRLAAGESVVLDAEPGTGRTQTIVNAVTEVIRAGGSTLVVAEHRRALEDVQERLRTIGLTELTLDVRESPAAARRAGAQLLEALDRHTAGDPLTGAGTEPTPTADLQPQSGADPLTVLRQHEQHLHERREPWGVSLAQAQDVLTRLAGLPQPPASHVRLDAEVLAALNPDRLDEVRRALTRAVAAGAWQRRSDDPWFGARITSTEEADRAADIVGELASARFTAAREEVARLCRKAGLPAPVNLVQWDRTFELLGRVRDTLDVFTPQVYEAPLDDLVQATTKRPGGSADQPSGMTRRRLRRQARSLLRPGTPPPDLTDQLADAREERQEWESLAGRAARPSTPRGWEDAALEYAEIRRQLSWLSEVLGDTAHGRDLETTHLDLLLERLIRLDARADRLAVTAAVHGDLQPLRDQGLGPLVDDLARRGVAAEDVEAEADLVFWASVHDQMAQLGEHATSSDLRQALRQLDDEAQAAMADTRRAVLRAGRSRVTDVLARHPEQGEALRAVVDAGTPMRMLDLIEAAPDLTQALRPCWLASPLTIPATTPATTEVDLLVVDEAQRVPVSHAVAALARARQVLVVGDSGGLPAVPLTTVVDEPGATEGVSSRSLLTAVSDVLPTCRLDTHYRSLDQRMRPRRAGSTVAGFPGVLRASRVTLLETDDLETLISTVTELVLDHARRAPQQSLGVLVDDAAVVTDIERALWARVAATGDLAGSFREDVSEPFLLSTAERAAGDVRDRVLVVLTGRPELGPDWGSAVLGAARRSVVVVTDRPLAHLPASPGIELIRHTVAAAAADPVGQSDEDVRLAASHAAAGSAELSTPTTATSAEPALIADLTARLRAEGLTVRRGFGHGPHRIELVVDDPDEPGRPLLAIDTDAQPAREELDAHQLRTRSLHLQRLGWTPLRVWTTDVFRDPAREVARIVDVARRASHERAQRSRSGPEDRP